MRLNGQFSLNYGNATMVNEPERIQARGGASGSTNPLPFVPTQQLLSEFEYVEAAVDPIFVARRCRMCRCSGHNAQT